MGWFVSLGALCGDVSPDPGTAVAKKSKHTMKKIRFG